MRCECSHTARKLFSSVQFSSVVQSCPTLCNPMNHSMPGVLVHHQLLKFTQTHAHRVSDAIQPSHPLSSPQETFTGILIEFVVVLQSLSCVRLFCNPMDYSPPYSFVHGVLQARIVEQVTISSSRGSADPGIEHVFCIGRRILYH